MSELYISLAFCSVFALMGVLAIVDPARILGWLNRCNPSIDPDDSAGWATVRFIGSFFIILALCSFVAELWKLYQ